jgi:hypothetical protein
MVNGWTDERRKRQAALIKTWRPWEKSTGPLTEQGKLRSRQNAFLHGVYLPEEFERRHKWKEMLVELKSLLKAAKKASRVE